MNRNRLENRVNWSPAENAEITTAVFRAARYRHGLSSTAVPDASQLENVPWGYFQSASVSSMPQPFIPPPPPVAESPSPFEMIRSQNLVIDRFIPPALPVEALPGSSDDSDDCNYRRRNRYSLYNFLDLLKTASHPGRFYLQTKKTEKCRSVGIRR